MAQDEVFDENLFHIDSNEEDFTFQYASSSDDNDDDGDSDVVIKPIVNRKRKAEDSDKGIQSTSQTAPQTAPQTTPHYFRNVFKFELSVYDKFSFKII